VPLGCRDGEEKSYFVCPTMRDYFPLLLSNIPPGEDLELSGANREPAGGSRRGCGKDLSRCNGMGLKAQSERIAAEGTD
jgi:hypothetical protein